MIPNIGCASIVWPTNYYLGSQKLLQTMERKDNPFNPSALFIRYADNRAKYADYRKSCFAII